MEFVLQVELSQGGQDRRGRTSAIFFSYRVRVTVHRRLRDLTREQGLKKVSAQVSSGILSDMHACFIACETGRFQNVIVVDSSASLPSRNVLANGGW